MGSLIVVIISLLAGFAGGGVFVIAVLWKRHAKIQAQAQEIKDKIDLLSEQKRRLEDERRQLYEKDRAQVAELTQIQNNVSEKESQLHKRALELDQRENAFNTRKVSYDDLRKENEICKRDLRNIDVSLSKSRLDVDQTRKHQAELDARSRELASRYLKENVKIIVGSVTGRNYAALKQRLLDVIERCRAIDFSVSPSEESQLLEDLKVEFEKAVHAELEREEQARIRERIREEQKLQREIDREIQQAEREKVAIKAALDKALAEAKDAHSLEVESLQAKLAEAEAKSERAMSRAQMTRSGNVYVISNIGSFGEGVFKVGMTRRLKPMERVIELGDASVPFPFDVHMMIACDDAPALETALHKALRKAQLNKVNPRKEFFKADIDTIRDLVEQHHGKVEYMADAEALEYRQSISMSDEDAADIEEVYEKEEEETAVIPDGM